jgi:nucleoside-diphosphate-sugar epimerase
MSAGSLAGAPLQILGSPDRRRDFTDVADVVRALVALGMRGESTTVNVGSGRTHTLSEVVCAIGNAACRGLGPEVGPAGTEEPHAPLAHADRCERVCGFVPEADLANVVRRQLDQALTRAA